MMTDAVSIEVAAAAAGEKQARSNSNVTTIIHCWSAPRSRSTALLYSFEALPGCVALDEPLYRDWLLLKQAESSGSGSGSVTRPYMEAMLTGAAAASADHAGVPAESWEREQVPFLQRLQQAVDHKGASLVFCKHMAKHDVVYDFANQLPGVAHQHVLLIRDPVAVLSSWKQSGHVHGHAPTMDEVGIVPLLTIYTKVCETNNNSHVTILDSDDLVAQPSKVLSTLCDDLNIKYSDEMLTWKAGTHACDGPWAKWWYHSVHKSTGWQPRSFMAPMSTYSTLSPDLLPALRASLPVYEFLYRQSYSYKTRGPPPSQLYEDPRNEHLLVWIGTPGRGRLVPREMACISPWDSIVQGGDGAWEGLRVYRGKILHLEAHLGRMIRSAKALGYYESGPVHTKQEITEAICRTLAANGMRDGAHMRLTLTRGEKYTSSMNPNFNVYGTTLIVLAEWKPTQGKTTYDNVGGISLITASQRRNRPDTVDSKIHHNNMINNILPKIQANLAGVADAIMLDTEGYVSETNATNIFMVSDDGVLLTPHADHCLPGITRATVLNVLAPECSVPAEERRVSLAEFHAAAEVFTTGTMGEITPVTKIDGRAIGTAGKRGPVTAKLQQAYQTLPERFGYELPEFSGTPD